jgi:hypothetical protein
MRSWGPGGLKHLKKCYFAAALVRALHLFSGSVAGGSVTSLPGIVMKSWRWNCESSRLAVWGSVVHALRPSGTDPSDLEMRTLTVQAQLIWQLQ